jgi:hypothetical protein
MNKFISGFGQFHSNELSSKIRKEYTAISFEEIQTMVDDPQSTPKPQARWFIPSTLPSRVHQTQREQGQFGCLWMDFDQDPKPLFEMVAFWNEHFGFDCEMYLTSSASSLKPKSRLIVPLAKVISGVEFVAYQEILLEFYAKHGIQADVAVTGAGQLCYLPNKGSFYESHSIRDGKLMDATKVFADEYAQRLAKQAQVESETAERINALKL